MDKEIFLGLPRFLKDITNQVALGGGEPTLYPDLVEQFTQECKDYDLICNLTTNGYLIKDWEDEKVEQFCDDLTMISVSLDHVKYRRWGNGNEFLKTCKKLQKHTLVGCNLLTDKSLMGGGNLIKMVDRLFERGLDRVFSLYPKNVQGPDILNKKHYYEFLTIKYPDFYIDDLTYKILDEEKYSEWDKPCHYGKDIISIDEKGQVSGCSFSDDYKLTLEKPADILKVNDVHFEDRHSCPYLRR
jgi:MoaA/NifB/PqqE/SkfB family radical SAM enzyme